jgi:N12 class adenine-specific DNA methylase
MKLRQTHGHRVATFAANSVDEMYVMQRYLQPDTLTAGVEHFDGWAAIFGRTVTALELAPDSSSYRMTTRFARSRMSRRVHQGPQRRCPPRPAR